MFADGLGRGGTDVSTCTKFLGIDSWIDFSMHVACVFPDAKWPQTLPSPCTFSYLQAVLAHRGCRHNNAAPCCSKEGCASSQHGEAEMMSVACSALGFCLFPPLFVGLFRCRSRTTRVSSGNPCLQRRNCRQRAPDFCTSSFHIFLVCLS